MYISTRISEQDTSVSYPGVRRVASMHEVKFTLWIWCISWDYWLPTTQNTTMNIFVLESFFVFIDETGYPGVLVTEHSEGLPCNWTLLLYFVLVISANFDVVFGWSWKGNGFFSCMLWYPFCVCLYWLLLCLYMQQHCEHWAIQLPVDVYVDCLYFTWFEMVETVHFCVLSTMWEPIMRCRM